MTENGFYAKDGQPIKCFKCGSDKLEDVIKDCDRGCVYESECNCTSCGQSLGYWAYGSWDDGYLRDIGVA